MSRFTYWLSLAAVGAAAYVLGARAGRSRYREISGAAKHLWDDPSLRKARRQSRKVLDKAAKKAAKKLGV
ncbi:hypothetical protein [Microbacterium dextranolyticum]|uniref:YtxH domain-containing protein n=1 Tax=Microbacterium dextranolyticum TaxID=36806 RepID=A0A9W6HMI8_9MICO|nr:hypothetical protein [Microbacterium dextranolyticum]MBM7463319.1 hypothetical protein [Microbacterium dextranolyticum]GLJ95577.1 hypothetical protein GCM10017591_16400 [Microbacterium dextranolyticum]